jgi:hypothetical protein
MENVVGGGYRRSLQPSTGRKRLTCTFPVRGTLRGWWRAVSKRYVSYPLQLEPGVDSTRKQLESSYGVGEAAFDLAGGRGDPPPYNPRRIPKAQQSAGLQGRNLLERCNPGTQLLGERIPRGNAPVTHQADGVRDSMNSRYTKSSECRT